MVWKFMFLFKKNMDAKLPREQRLESRPINQFIQKTSSKIMWTVSTVRQRQQQAHKTEASEAD